MFILLATTVLIMVNLEDLVFQHYLFSSILFEIWNIWASFPEGELKTINLWFTDIVCIWCWCKNCQGEFWQVLWCLKCGGWLTSRYSSHCPLPYVLVVANQQMDVNVKAHYLFDYSFFYWSFTLAGVPNSCGMSPLDLEFFEVYIISTWIYI